MLLRFLWFFSNSSSGSPRTLRCCTCSWWDTILSTKPWSNPPKNSKIRPDFPSVLLGFSGSYLSESLPGPHHFFHFFYIMGGVTNFYPANFWCSNDEDRYPEHSRNIVVRERNLNPNRWWFSIRSASFFKYQKNNRLTFQDIHPLLEQNIHLYFGVWGDVIYFIIFFSETFSGLMICP